MIDFKNYKSLGGRCWSYGVSMKEATYYEKGKIELFKKILSFQ